MAATRVAGALTVWSVRSPDRGSVRLCREHPAAPRATHRHDLSEDRQRHLLGAGRADVESDRGVEALDVDVAEALRSEPGEALLVRAATADRADVAGAGAQGRDERWVVELLVVGEDDNRRRGVEREPAERLLGPGADQLVGGGEAVAARERLPRVGDDDPIAKPVPDPGEGHGHVGGADDRKKRRRAGDVEEDLFFAAHDARDTL